eukprot:TRINITY_DN1206_c0_g1_i1.p1 TRINITY_DN1206_c0_g1~~TRINITY_DN1206_c0_g1_i1.p1  ORF type:complete len:480 (-),score=86.38 TRINITY_DN1206_c0_g1_i1:776-2215(-)
MGAYTPIPMGVTNLAAARAPVNSFYVLPEIPCSHWRARGVQQNSRPRPGISIGRVRILHSAMEQQQLGLYTGGNVQGDSFVRAVGQSDSVYWEREEVRWMREEQRWLREEQRWLREEQRWNTERQAWAQESIALNNEIKALKQEILSLQESNKNSTPSGSTLADLMAGLNSLLRSLREAETVETRISSSQAQIASSSSSSRKIDSLSLKDTVPVVTTYLAPVEVVKSANGGAALEHDPIVLIQTRKTRTATSPETSTSSGTPTALKQRRTLKKGTEGDDVKVLQDALAALGFFSGEDEMEFSTFDAGTESAVKTWQSTVGAVEDGVLTKELLARLFGETPKASSVSEKVAPAIAVKAPQFPPKGTAVKSKPKATVVPEIDRYGTSSTDNRNERRVYLLGENRWEEPSRLLNRNGRGTSTAVQEAISNCFGCKGVGTMMCTECEGTGELNVEEQFLDWVEEGAKCPYCEGSGAVKCDVCN